MPLLWVLASPYSNVAVHIHGFLHALIAMGSRKSLNCDGVHPWVLACPYCYGFPQVLQMWWCPSMGSCMPLLLWVPASPSNVMVSIYGFLHALIVMGSCRPLQIWMVSIRGSCTPLAPWVLARPYNCGGLHRWFLHALNIMGSCNPLQFVMVSIHGFLRALDKGFLQPHEFRGAHLCIMSF